MCAQLHSHMWVKCIIFFQQMKKVKAQQLTNERNKKLQNFYLKKTIPIQKKDLSIQHSVQTVVRLLVLLDSGNVRERVLL